MTVLTIAIQDSTTMLRRELKHTLRFPLLLVSTILVPVVMLVLFDYILGGPIGHGLGDAAHGAPYVDFLVPGIILLTVAAGCGPAASSIRPITPSSSSMPHAAATSPNARCRVRCGITAASRASSIASISAAVPRYRSDTIFGLPSTRAISRRYQYVFPPIVFGYRLAIL